MLSLVIPLERFSLFFLFLRVVLLVEPFFPVSEKFDNPDVNEVAYLVEILWGLEVFVLFSQDHFKFLFSEYMVVRQLWLNHFLSELILAVTCTWNQESRSTRFP